MRRLEITSRNIRIAGLLGILLSLAACLPNSPYRSEEIASNTFFTSFGDDPKHLDPAISYSSDEYDFIAQIYEPPLQYHYLKRPFELIPRTATEIPSPIYFDPEGNRIEDPDPPADAVGRVEYEIRIQEGIRYQPHPCFARDAEGNLLYHELTEEDTRGIDDIGDFRQTGTRELIAADYAYQIRRLADPSIGSPIYSSMREYILGLEELSAAIERSVETAQERHRENDAGNEGSQHIIVPDYNNFEFPGAVVVDRYTYRIVLKKKYPQIVHWLTMPFFTAIPEEAVRFYAQEPLRMRNVTLDRYPVGTGPYRMEHYQSNYRIVLVRNENFREDTYPMEGETGDAEAGLLEDAGRRVPFIDRVIFSREKESIPLWNKFLQGYYDSAGIPSDSFDQAVQFSSEGPELTEELREKNIRLVTSVATSTYYMGFNMLDPVVGGYTDERRKLRQAISIALNIEERIQIFANGRGIPAHGILPPGIFGYESVPGNIEIPSRDSYNPFVYDWNEAQERAERKTIETARALLAEAGYPNGRDAQGRQLAITYDTTATSASARQLLEWIKQQFDRLGIHLNVDSTDYARFRDKMNNGSFQFFGWGWNADYPDPENFFFLLYGPNGKTRYGGENASNYDHPEFNALFERMESMTNTPERLAIIREMNRIAREDAPLIWGYHPKGFALLHDWYHNEKPNPMARNTLQYKRIEPRERLRLVRVWNRPNLIPVWIASGLLFIGSIPALLSIWRKQRGDSRP